MADKRLYPLFWRDAEGSRAGRLSRDRARSSGGNDPILSIHFRWTTTAVHDLLVEKIEESKPADQRRPELPRGGQEEVRRGGADAVRPTACYRRATNSATLSTM